MALEHKEWGWRSHEALEAKVCPCWASFCFARDYKRDIALGGCCLSGRGPHGTIWDTKEVLSIKLLQARVEPSPPNPEVEHFLSLNSAA